MQEEAFMEMINELHKSSRQRFQELDTVFQGAMQWMKDIAEGIEKQTAESHILLPKTPTAKRTRKRAYLPRVSDYGKFEEVSNSSLSSVSSHYNTRSTRGNNQTKENISPVLVTKKKRSTYKNANKKIKQQVNFPVYKKMHRPTEDRSVRESRDEISNDERPSKCRRLDFTEPFKSMVPLVEKMSDSELRKYGQMQTESPCVSSSVDDECPEKRKKISEVTGSLANTVTSTVNEKISSEFSLSVGSSITSKNNLQENSSQRSKNSIQITDSVVSSAIGLKETVISRHSEPEMCNEVKHTKNAPLLEQPLQNTDSTAVVKPGVIEASIPNLSTCVEESDNIITQHSSSSEKEKCETSFGNLKNGASKVSKSRNASETNKLINEIDETESNETPTNLSLNVLKKDITEESEKRICSPVVLKKTSKYLHCRTPSPKVSKHPELKTQVFSPFANEPVRQRVAAYERLRTLSEEPAVQETQQSVRTTRTKTRGMLVAEAATVVGNVETSENDLQNTYNMTKMRQMVAAEAVSAIAETSNTNGVKIVTRTKTRAMVAAESSAVTENVEPPKNDLGKTYNMTKMRHMVAAEAASAVAETSNTDEVKIITRTKTRAMVAAEAAATAASVVTESQHVKEEMPTQTETRSRAAKGIDCTKDGVSQPVTEASTNARFNNWKASRKSVAKAKKISLAKEKREKDTLEEVESSKENSMTAFSATKRTPYGYMTPYGYRTGERYQPLSSSNISNISAHSASRIYGFGSSSKGYYLVNKQSNNIVTGVESFIPKHTRKPTVEDIEEKKMEELKRIREREEEAMKKREQTVKKRKEEIRRKQEEKMQRVMKAREVLSKQQQNSEKRLQEKEEKLKQLLQERGDKMKEQVQQKKQLNQLKAAEIEDRRKLEEAIRMQKIKEQEEEQRQLQEARKREREEAEKQLQKRLAQEKEVAALKEQQAVKAAQAQAKLVKQAKEKNEVKTKTAVMNATFDVSKHSGGFERNNSSKEKMITNNDNYEMDDKSGESSEDEERPKKPIPLWATKDKRWPRLKEQHYKVGKIEDSFMSRERTTPDLTQMFGMKQIKRTSSAVWRTPPRYSTLPKY